VSGRGAYRVNEIFTSLQGEGQRVGSVNTFVRFAGCNLQCSRDGPEGFDCDTEFTSGRWLTLEQLVAAATASWDRATSSHERRACILTGGEPMLQVDAALVDALHEARFFVAVETNGTQLLKPGVAVDWVSCSPKTADHTIRIERADEVRVVRHDGQGEPRSPVPADHLFLSPAFGADGQPEPGALRTCVELCKSNPRWRLSVQQHKSWGVR
jgi:7-carboxy-7-deazaguanine synthase